MSKALTVKQETQVSVPVAQVSSETGIDPSLVKPTRIHLLQNTSELVGDGQAQLGDIAILGDDTSVIGGIDKPVEIVPMYMFETWVIMDCTEQPAKFLRVEPLNASNKMLPWEDIENGVPIKRLKTINWFVMIRKDMATDKAFPAIATFKSTSYKAGQNLASAVFKSGFLGKPAYAKSYLLGSKREKGEKSTYAVYTITKGENTTPAEIECVQRLLPLVTKPEIKNEVLAAAAYEDKSSKSAPSTEDIPF